VVDAPASGHGLAMLTTPRTFGEIARVGPIRRQAHKVRELLTDPGDDFVAALMSGPRRQADQLEALSAERAEGGLR